MMIEKGGGERMIRRCFDKFSKYQKLSVVYLNIYHRDIGLNKSYLQGNFYFLWIKIQQVHEVLEKIQNEVGKTQSYFNGLGNHSRDLIDCEKNLPKKL